MNFGFLEIWILDFEIWTLDFGILDLEFLNFARNNGNVFGQW
jgi:hypothetical protein